MDKINTWSLRGHRHSNHHSLLPVTPKQSSSCLNLGLPLRAQGHSPVSAGFCSFCWGFHTENQQSTVSAKFDIRGKEVLFGSLTWVIWIESYDDFIWRKVGNKGLQETTGRVVTELALQIENQGQDFWEKFSVFASVPTKVKAGNGVRNREIQAWLGDREEGERGMQIPCYSTCIRTWAE